MQRYLNNIILQDLAKKIVLLTGPRQVGKTTLSKSLFSDYEYLNFDITSHRPLITEMKWKRKVELVIFDEIHKMNQWKSWLKGIYDDEGVTPKILVTGSARLDTAKKVGDSLAGRFFEHRLYPLTVKELSTKMDIQTAYERLLKRGGFPEPFFADSDDYHARWRTSHLDIILRQDLIDLEKVRNIIGIETLIELLRLRVGSTVSANNLANDLGVAVKTIQKWLVILENLYVIFRVTPKHKNVARSLLKMPKFYFYDIAQVQSGIGAKIENLVALSLLREIDLEKSLKGRKITLNYLRNTDGHEIDFVLSENQDTLNLIEVKTSDDKQSPGFKTFSVLNPKKMTQVVANLKKEQQLRTGVNVLPIVDWLATLSI